MDMDIEHILTLIIIVLNAVLAYFNRRATLRVEKGINGHFKSESYDVNASELDRKDKDNV